MLGCSAVPTVVVQTVEAYLFSLPFIFPFASYDQPDEIDSRFINHATTTSAIWFSAMLKQSPTQGQPGSGYTVP
jgi:hypothetical protein